MNRIFTDSPPNQDVFSIEGKDAHHLLNVLRVQKDEKIEIIFNGQVYIAEIESIQSNCLDARIKEIDRTEYESPLKIHLFQSYLKSDKMDWVIQKAVELGVSEITPIFTKRTIVKLTPSKIKNKMKRFEKIIESAAKQSKRVITPTIHQACDLEELEFNDFTILAYEEENESISNILSKNDFHKVNIILGPEGGFEKSEVNLLASKNAKSVSLGKRILRAETATISLISILQYLKGDLK